MLNATAAALFDAHADAEPEKLSRALEDAGFPHLLVGEAQGGFGGNWGDFLEICSLAAGRCINFPLGESIVAHWAASRAGLDLPSGLTLIAPDFRGKISKGRMTGVFPGVPWGRCASSIVTSVQDMLVLVDVRKANIVHSSNMADEARDALTVFDAPVIGSAPWQGDLRLAAAMVRIAQIKGASAFVLGLTIDYSNIRTQFGKPIAEFQSVQQNVATLACEVSAVQSAACGAALAMDKLGLVSAPLEIAAAKLRVNKAVPRIVSISHQVHGAIGFTQEYALQRASRRLLAWRAEHGNDRYWGEKLGELIVAKGGAGAWQEITRNSDVYLA